VQKGLGKKSETRLRQEEKEGGKRKEMSAKLKRNERCRRFRRSRVSINERRGVSPVVATLILILIAVAAAAALYLWLVAWQGGVTAGIGSPTAQSTLTIGGSTSVYPWSVVAVKSFEGNNSNIVISVNQGGSGAGMAAVCAGTVDIGASSSPQTYTALTTQYGCPSTVVQETVAYDAVDVIVPVANVHGLQSISWDTMQAIYVAGVGGAPIPVQPQTNLESSATGYFMDGTDVSTLAGFVAIPSTGLVWNQIPACAAGLVGVAAGCSGTTLLVETGTPAISAAAATVPCGVTTTGDLCFAAAAASPCGFTVCAGGATPTATIHAWQRQDAGGTTQSFTARILGVSSSATGSTASVGFSGCQPTGQLTDCGIAGSHQGSGNPGVIAGVAGDRDGIGYASDGLVVVSGSNVIPIGFQGIGQTVPVVPLVATTIVAGIVAGNGGTYGTGTYIGWRPFIYVQTNIPTGEVLRYLQWCMQPGNNQEFALQANELSPFQPGLAGHVPVTPIP
jgi:flagellin-like protein